MYRPSPKNITIILGVLVLLSLLVLCKNSPLYFNIHSEKQLILLHSAIRTSGLSKGSILYEKRIIPETIHELKLKGDTLTIDFTYHGCNEDNLNLVMETGGYAVSIPPQAMAYLSRAATEKTLDLSACTKVIRKIENFDVSSVRQIIEKPSYGGPRVRFGFQQSTGEYKTVEIP